MKKVSIVVPVYNMGDKIKSCMSSLINQTYENIEIILVDDGSKDDSYVYCKNLEQIDNRIMTFHIENQGAGPARNHGIENASGQYIYFPDADDYLEPDAISILVEAATKSGSDLLVFGYKKINQKGKVVSVKEYESNTFQADSVRNRYFPFYNMAQPFSIQGAPWNKFFSLEVIKRFSIRYPALRRHQDEAFIARYVTNTKQITFLHDVLYTYSVNDLKCEWEKYPLDYIDAVKGLYLERKRNLLVWSSNDEETHNQVYKEYFTNAIKAMELTYSPKFGFSKSQRIEWMHDEFSQLDILQINVPNGLKRYHKIVISCLKCNKYRTACFFMRAKIFYDRFIRK